MLNTLPGNAKWVSGNKRPSLHRGRIEQTSENESNEKKEAEVGAEEISRKELFELLDAAVDGIDGYEGETGYLRYWNAEKITRARDVLENKRREDANGTAQRQQREIASEDRFGEDAAKAVATALGGAAWQSGGGIWLTVITRTDGHLVVVSGDVVCEYESEKAFEDGRPDVSLLVQ
jgi:hypothetical protein